MTRIIPCRESDAISLMHEAIDGDVGLELVGDIQDGAHLEAAVHRLAPDVVVVAPGDDAEASFAARLLLSAPHARVVTILARGQAAAVYELRPHRTPMADVSMRALLDAMHAGRVFPIAAPGRD